MVAEGEEGPVAGLVLEAFRVLDRRLQADEVAHEVALAAGRFLGADADEFLDHHGAIAKLAGLLVVGIALRVDIDGVEIGERGLAAVELVGGQRRANVHPFAIALGLLELPVPGEIDKRRLTLGRSGPGEHE